MQILGDSMHSGEPHTHSPHQPLLYSFFHSESNPRFPHTLLQLSSHIIIIKHHRLEEEQQARVLGMSDTELALNDVVGHEELEGGVGRVPLAVQDGEITLA